MSIGKLTAACNAWSHSLCASLGEFVDRKHHMMRVKYTTPHELFLKVPMVLFLGLGPVKAKLIS